MDEEHRPPLNIFGLPVKPLVILIVVLLTLLVIFERNGWERLTSHFLPADQSSGETSSQKQTPGDIVATPEMISRAMRELQTAQLNDLEAGRDSSPGDKYYYIIELQSGGDLEAFDIEILPEAVTLSSTGGTQITLPRTAVKKITPVKLPATKP